MSADELLREAREYMRHGASCESGYDCNAHECDCGYESLLSRIDAHLASGGWIDCKDRLPEEGQSVLIEWKGAIHKTCRADGEWLLPANSPAVTIWQPLPSLPKETT